MFGRDANLIVSVRSPVGTGVWKIGQRITISDITFGPSGWLLDMLKGPIRSASTASCGPSASMLNSKSILQLQDEIVGRVSRAIGLQVVEIEARRSWRERPDSAELIDLAASACVTARAQSRLRHGKVIFATSTLRR
jgi:hypothetical protein